MRKELLITQSIGSFVKKFEVSHGKTLRVLDIDVGYIKYNKY